MHTQRSGEELMNFESSERAIRRNHRAQESSLGMA